MGPQNRHQTRPTASEEGKRTMWIERCNNHQCRRPYQVNEFDRKTLDREAIGSPKGQEIVCPHCGHTEVLWSESIFVVHALSAEQEQDFNMKRQLRWY
jgi:hypothetical protein